MADQEAVDEQVQEPAEAEGAEVADALLTDEPEAPAVEERDWMQDAVKDPAMRARFQEMMFPNQAQAQPAPVDPVTEAQSKLAEVEARRPGMDPENVTGESVTGYLAWLDEKNAALNAVQAAQVQAFQRQMMPVQAEQALTSYITRAKRYLPELADVESEFKDFVRANNIDPNLIGEQAIMDHLAKSVLYEHAKSAPKRVKAPPPAVDESYAAQGQSARAASEQAARPRALSEQEMAVARFLRMSPEEYADPKWGDPNDQGWEADGVFQITDDRRIR